MTAPVKKSWRCFHCDQVFTTPGSAREHFGGVTDATPAQCQTLPAGQSIRVGDFLLLRLRGGNFWLSHPDGEGMETTQAKLQELFRGFFEREF